jgi:hypothetical protein
MQKLKKRIAAAMAAFKAGVKPLPMQPCEVIIIEDGNEVGRSLGITHERAMYLTTEMANICQDKTDFSANMVAISRLCKHPNELFWVGIQLGANLYRDGHMVGQTNNNEADFKAKLNKWLRDNGFNQQL